MWRSKTLNIHIGPKYRGRAEDGSIPFFVALMRVFREKGHEVRFRGLGLPERMMSAAFPGYSVFFRRPTLNARTLYLRDAYAPGYWRIERGARRADWGAARAAFDPAETDRAEAAAFLADWRRRSGAEAALPDRAPFVYVPLQGMLTRRRGFQTVSPVGMIRSIRAHVSDLPIVVTLHPGTTYTRGELAAVQDLAQDPRITISRQPMHDLLAGCAFVATQNSSVAFWGLLHAKPAVLFAEADFHHLFHDVRRLGPEAALRRAREPLEDAGAYFHWFLTRHAINGDDEMTEARLLARLDQLGWRL